MKFIANMENLTEQETEALLRLIQKSEGFTEESLELLKTPLPKNPCATCNMGVACCGCPDGRMYHEKVEPYKKLGVYDIACDLRDIAKRQKEIADIKARLPKEIIKIFFQEDYLLDYGTLGGVWSL